MTDDATINVLVGLRYPPELLDRIRAVDPRLRVVDGSDGWRADFARRRRALTPQEEETLAANEQQLREADIYFNMDVPHELVERGPRLQWVHLASVGIDHLLGTSLLASDLTITYSRGVNARRVGETAVGMMYMLAGGARRLLEQQQRKEWQTFNRVVLHGKTLAVVGLGSIGMAVAEVASAAGLKVIGTRRGISERIHEEGVVATFYPPSELQEMLAEADVVIIAVPLTPETRGMIGAAELAVMKPSAFLINVARGPVVDEAALIEALRSARLGGAALDVFAQEPLAQDSPFWELPNVIVSPHIAGRGDTGAEEQVEFFIGNLRRFLNGMQMVNVVQNARGY